MSHDGLPARAASGARAATADRRASSRKAALAVIALAAIAFGACSPAATTAPATAGASGSPSTGGASSAPSIEPSASASAGKLSISFTEANASQVFGGAFINDLSDGASAAVTIGVVAIGFKDPLPAVLEQGSCANLAGAPAPSGSPGTGASAAHSSGKPSMFGYT